MAKSPLILPDLPIDDLDAPQRPADPRRVSSIPPRRDPPPNRPDQAQRRQHTHPHQPHVAPPQEPPGSEPPAGPHENELPRMPRHRRKRHGGRGER